LFSQDLAEVETDQGERFVLSLNPDLEYVQQQYLNLQKEKTLQRLKEIKNSWHLRRLQNRDNKLKIKNKETDNKKSKSKIRCNAVAQRSEYPNMNSTGSKVSVFVH